MKSVSDLGQNAKNAGDPTECNMLGGNVLAAIIDNERHHSVPLNFISMLPQQLVVDFKIRREKKIKQTFNWNSEANMADITWAAMFGLQETSCNIM